jgi:hypothetical protein
MGCRSVFLQMGVQADASIGAVTRRAPTSSSNRASGTVRPLALSGASRDRSRLRCWVLQIRRYRRLAQT